MKHNLDTLISKLQHQIHQIDAEAEAWKAQNEEKLKTAISSQTAEVPVTCNVPCLAERKNNLYSRF